MKIEYLKYENFFSVGNTPVEINFNDYGNIVLIKGINKDIHANDEDIGGDEMHSNSAGKSLVSEGLSYGLYGDFIRNKANHTNAINHKNKKGLCVEVIFKLKDYYYRIVRTRKNPSNELKLWKSKDKIWDDETEITQGGIPATQKEIDKILGLNHKAFANIVCFGQHNERSFLDCDAKDKREIAESLLSLDVFKTCADHTKEVTKDIKRDLKDLVKEYERLKENEASCAKRVESLKHQKKEWHQKCLDEIAKFENNILTLKKKLELSDNNLLEVEEAHKNMKVFESKISEYKNKKAELKTHIEDTASKLNDIKVKKHNNDMLISNLENENRNISKDILACQKEIDNLLSLTPGVKCDVCYSEVDPENYQHILDSKNDKIKSLETKISSNNVAIKKHQKDNGEILTAISKIKNLTSSIEEKIEKIDDAIFKCHNKISELGKVEAKASSEDLLIQQKIQQIEENIDNKKKEIESGGPYIKLLRDAEEELNSKSNECKKSRIKISDMEDLIPYYEWWIKGYTDRIRSYVVSGILPSLNDKIAYWLDILINSKIKLQFDEELEPAIERNPPDGNNFVYHTMSGGLKKRIDLSIIQSFADVIMLSSETHPSILFLDEIGTDFDIRGKEQIYKMICEFAQSRQVFVITHDPILLDMLQGVDTITMKLENGITTMVKQ